MFNSERNNKKGFTLVETIIYIGVAVMIFVVCISILVSFTKSYRTILALRVTESSAIDSLERMTHDIRSAGSVTSVSSSTITLVSNHGGNSTTTMFYVQDSSGRLIVNVNGVDIGPLTASNVSVSNLVFQLLNSGRSRAVRIQMILVGKVGSVSETENYYSTVVLKGV
jgi:Tfp pilus assembly protein PilW